MVIVTVLMVIVNDGGECVTAMVIVTDDGDCD